MVETIGIVGGGQLGRMLTEAAKPMGFEVVAVDRVEDENGEPYAPPAVQAGARHVEIPFNDPCAPYEIADMCDVMTIEVEHVAAASLSDLRNKGHDVQPSPDSIWTIQDKLLQKERLKEAEVPVAEFMAVDSKEDFEAAKDMFGNVIIKSRRGGFDGRGNLVIDGQSWADVHTHFTDKYGADTDLYAEKIVPFQRELAVLVARGRNGEIITYPVVETIHRNNICHMVLSPADIDPRLKQKAEKVGLEAVNCFDGAGVFAVEQFVDENGEVIVNEIAPRVHNSGHHTIESCVTSQFEQHIRAITGLPLGDTFQLRPAVMINILGERNGEVEVMGLDEVLALKNTHVHLYGKKPTKIDRKMGHITVVATTIGEARERAEQARASFSI